MVRWWIIIAPIIDRRGPDDWRTNDDPKTGMVIVSVMRIPARRRGDASREENDQKNSTAHQDFLLHPSLPMLL
jgi:hypothetical protein